MTFGPDNNLYVGNFNSTDFSTNDVLRYNGTTGAFIDAFVPNGRGGLNSPAGLIFSPTPVPEPSPTWGLLGLGTWGAVSQVKNKLKKQKLASRYQG